MASPLDRRCVHPGYVHRVGSDGTRNEDKQVFSRAPLHSSKLYSRLAAKDLIGLIL